MVLSRLLFVLGFIGLLSFWGYSQHPRELDRTFRGIGARALGMGGAYLLATDDATAIIWNPAALAYVHRFTFPIEIVGRTNFNVWGLKDLVDDLETIRDQIGDQPVLSLLAEAIRRVRGFALQNGVRPGEPVPRRFKASLAPLIGFSFGQFGFAVSNNTLGEVVAFIDQQTDPDPNDTLPPADHRFNIYARGNVLSLTSFGIGWVRRKVFGVTWGVTLRGVRADYIAFAASAGVDDLEEPTDGDVQGIAYDWVKSPTRFTLDMGVIIDPPLQPSGIRFRFGAVARNIFPLRFRLPVVELTKSPDDLPTPQNFDFRLDPQIDVGAMGILGDGRTVIVLELHNITGGNGGKTSFHAGLEQKLGGVFAFRLGLDDGHPVFGVGLHLGLLRLDVAMGAQPKRRLGVGLSLRF